MGGSNSLFKNVLNPASIFLKDKYSWFFDPAGQMTTQSLQNIYNWTSGKEEFGQHKDWWGTGEGGWGNHTMRKWTEGKKYKQWDAWEANQVRDYDAQSAKYYNKPKEDTSILNTHQKNEDLVPKNMGTRTTQSVEDESLLSTSLSTNTY